MNDRPGYPWSEGDALFASELNAAIANAGGKSKGAVNVLDYGADPTGVADCSAAFNAALAVRRYGRPVDVFVPAGGYLLNAPVTFGDTDYPQRLFGGGWSTTLMVGPGFSSSAAGVIVISSVPYNDPRAQASVCDLQILFRQPPDFSTTTTAVTAVGGTTLTVASVANVHVGYYCFDSSNPAALPWQSITPKVVSIAGNVVTLDRPAIGTINVGDILLFAANRSQAVALSSTPTLNPGAPAIKYPWAIYCVAQSVFIDHVLVAAAWNGVYIRGQTLGIGQYFVGCLNIGLDVDQCYSFPKIEHFMLWGWGLPVAMQGIYYDGQTVAANLGQCDGLTCDSLMSWCGVVNLTATWSWGAFNQLALDGDNANLNIVGNGAGWAQIGQFYKTGGSEGIGVPLVLSGNTIVSIDNVYMAVAQHNPGITVSSGSLTIGGGYIWNGTLGYELMRVTGGALSLDQMRFDISSPSRFDAYLIQTGGVVRVSNSGFVNPPVAGTAAFILTGSPRNSVANVDLNGWGGTLPPTALPRVAISTSYVNDAAAAAGGVEVGQEYRNGSIKMVRVV